MLGLAVGDALGAGVEGMRGGHIRQIYESVDDYVASRKAFPDAPRKWRMPGLYTDDTQQALAVADVLCEESGMDAERLAELYVELRDGMKPERGYFGCHRGTGGNFRKAVNAFAESGDVLGCGQPSAGSGAAMRIAPVGLFFSDDPDAIRDAVMAASLVTHSDPRGIAGAAAMAKAAQLLMNMDEGEKNFNALCDELVAFVYDFEEFLKEEFWDSLDAETRIIGAHHMSQALESLASCVREQNDDLARKSIVNQANRMGPEHAIKDANVGFAPASVTVAIYYALRYDSFYNGLTAAINDGRDTDTVGAMVGALLGIRLGAEAIPEEWLAGLKNREQVALRGSMLAEREVDWALREPLAEMERDLTQSEIAFFAQDLQKWEKGQSDAVKKHPPKPKKTQSEPDRSQAVPAADEWLDGGGADPIQKRKEKEQRGRKRIDWKEERRKKQRE